eukprot:scaffold25958_cov88-Phaeocystis_antarctica.AAC.2
MATRPRAVRPGGVCLFNTEFHALNVETRDRTVITQNVLSINPPLNTHQIQNPSHFHSIEFSACILGSSLNSPVWERFYVAIPRNCGRFAAPKSESPTRISREETALNGPVQTDARPPRDGSEQFGSGTQAYGQI